MLHNNQVEQFELALGLVTRLGNHLQEVLNIRKLLYKNTGNEPLQNIGY